MFIVLCLWARLGWIINESFVYECKCLLHLESAPLLCFSVGTISFLCLFQRWNIKTPEIPSRPEQSILGSLESPRVSSLCSFILEVSRLKDTFMALIKAWIRLSVFWHGGDCIWNQNGRLQIYLKLWTETRTNGLLIDVKRNGILKLTRNQWERTTYHFCRVYKTDKLNCFGEKKPCYC